MLAKKCDICGKYYESYEKHVGTETKLRHTNTVVLTSKNEEGRFIYDQLSDFYSKSYDLCPECMDKLIYFVTGRGRDKEV